MPQTVRRTVVFGPFRLEADDRLYVEERPVHLPPKELALLRLLAEADGRVVRKEDIFDRVWPDTAVSDASLTRCIRSIRAALGERGRQGGYIETLHGRGYRFAGTVVAIDASRTVASTTLSRVLVAPLANARMKRDDESLCEGLSEELTDELARRLAGHHGVISSHTALHVKGKDAVAAASELRAAHVVAGSLERREDSIRVRLELIRVRDGVQLCSRRYDCAADAAIGLATEIGADVAELLLSTPSAPPPATESFRPISAAMVRAHRAVLEGRYLARMRTEAGMRAGLERFRQACADAPDYAVAHVAIAQAHLMLAFRGVIRPLDAAPVVRESLARALALDSGLLPALVALGQLAYNIEWNLPAAESVLRRTLALEPGYPPACLHLGELLTATGRFDEAISVRRLGFELDPLSPSLRLGLAQTLLWSRRTDEALEEGRMLTQDLPGFLAGYAVHACAAYLEGRRDEAIVAARTCLRITPSEPVGMSGCAWVLAVCDERDVARAATGKLDEIASERPGAAVYAAIAHAGLGEDDAALAWLERAYAERNMFLPLLTRDVRFARLGSHPRVREIFTSVVGPT